MEWVRMQEMMAAPPAPAMVKHHSHLHRRSDSIGMDLPTSDVHGHGRMDDPKPFVLVDSKNRVRELTSTAPIKIPATKPLTMPMSVPSRATMMEDQPMMDEQAQLEQQLQMQKEEMHFHRPLPRPQLNQGAPYPPTSSGHEQRPLLFGHAFTYSDNNSQSFMNPLKTPPTVPPISPFAGLALSAPAKTTISSAKNPFASRFGAPSSSSSISDNSPRLPSLNAFRSGSPGPLKMGIAAPRPPPLSLRTGESGSQSMSGLPTSMPSMSPPVQTSFVNFSSSLSTQPSTPLFAPSQPPSHGFSQSLPSVSFLSERRANNMSFDGSESITMSSDDEDARDPASLLGSSLESRSSLGPRSGRICRHADCSNIARSRGLCRTHGGGKRCSHPNCNKSAQANRKCIAHGGGTPCSFADCNKTAQSRGLCKAHGGGARCKHPDCPKSSQSKGLCRGHGGGIKCKEEGCEKWVQKNGYCIKHGRERSMTT